VKQKEFGVKGPEARMRAATGGSHSQCDDPGYRFAHPGYACSMTGSATEPRANTPEIAWLIWATLVKPLKDSYPENLPV
jgi:hypothetical protein